MMTQQQLQRFEKALKRVGGEQETLSMLAGIAAEDAPPMLRSLDAAASGRNASGYAATAHALKGLLSTFEMEYPVSELQPIIDAARQNELDEVAKLHTSLSPKLKVLVDEIRQLSHATED